MLNKNNFIFILKLFVSAALLFYIYISIPWKDVSDVILSTSIDLLILSILFQIFSYLLLAYRWGIIVRGFNASITSNDIIKVSYIGTAFNNILPGSIGGDFVRGAYIIKKGMSLKSSILSLVIDRFLGLFFTLIFVFIFLYIYSNNDPFLSNINLLIMIMMLALLFLIVVFKVSFFHKKTNRFLYKTLSLGYYEKITPIIKSLYNYSIKKNLIIGLFIMTIAATILEILVFWLASKSLGMNYSLYLFIIAVPLTILISTLPISLGGLLVREASGLFLLSILGIEMLDASSIIILYIPILIISSIPGAYFYLRSSKK
jgi:uncharacterized protein (TIRG00374 family)